MYDVIVIGGGPAGMTAGLYALRANRSVLILEKNGFGGQITYSPKVENYPGTMEMSGSEFADRMLEQVMAQGADVELEEAVSVTDGPVKVVTTAEGGRYEGRSVILAVGVKHRMLGVPGEDELVGSGISFCAVCDGAFYRDREVVVVGGGNSALQEAILLSENCSKVTIVQNLDFLTGDGKLRDKLMAKENVEVILGTVVTGFEAPDGILSGVRVKTAATGSERVIPAEGVFVAIGLIPENEAFKALAQLDERGYFASGEDCRSQTPGVFVAGDCRSKSVRQITTACADGAIAAVAACEYLDTL